MSKESVTYQSRFVTERLEKLSRISQLKGWTQLERDLLRSEISFLRGVLLKRRASKARSKQLDELRVLSVRLFQLEQQSGS